MATQRYSVTPHLIETILITNYAVTQSEINIAIGDKAPSVYFPELMEQCQGGKKKYGGITDLEELRANLQEHYIPTEMVGPLAKNYDESLE